MRNNKRFNHWIFQLGIFFEAKKSLDIGEKHTFIWSRIIEGLLESCPQSLFQLFIVLKNSETYSTEQLIRYYFSIFVSILSLTSALITFEFFTDMIMKEILK